MTRDEALKEAIYCFQRVTVLRASSYAEPDKAISLRMQALAMAGQGYIELAKELRVQPLT